MVVKRILCKIVISAALLLQTVILINSDSLEILTGELINRRMKELIILRTYNDGRRGIYSYRTENTTPAKAFPEPLKSGEEYIEDRLSGPVIAFRFISYLLDNLSENDALVYLGKVAGRQKLIELFDKIIEMKRKDPKELKTMEKRLEDEYARPILELITDKVKPKNPDSLAYAFVEGIGKELGDGLGVLMGGMLRSKNVSSSIGSAGKEFLKNIVLVGGVSDNFVKEIKGSKEDLFLEWIREGIRRTLISQYGFSEESARDYTQGVIRSKLVGADREYLAFIPTGKDKFTIALSAGGVKLSAGIVNSDAGISRAQKDTIKWDVEYKDFETWFSYNDEQKNRERTRVRKEVLDMMFNLIIMNAITKVGGPGEIEQIGFSWAGPGDYNKGWVKGTNMPGLDEMFNLKDEIKSRLSDIYGNKAKKIIIVIKHDGASHIEGDVSPKGTLSGENNAMAVIIGGGIGAGIYINGKTFRAGVNDTPLGEIGHHIIFMPQK